MNKDYCRHHFWAFIIEIIYVCLLFSYLFIVICIWFPILCLVILCSAIAIYSRSPSAYTALKNLGIVQLPCERQVEKLIKSNHKKAGFDEEAVAREVSKYDEFTKLQLEKGRPKPLGFGALIFDETKVQSKILFEMNGGMWWDLQWLLMNFLSLRIFLNL